MHAHNSDHRRLGRQLSRLQPAVAMAEALARAGDANEGTNTEMLAHARQHLQWEVHQGGRHGRRAGPNLAVITRAIPGGAR
jgi:hypothetical protein